MATKKGLEVHRRVRIARSVLPHSQRTVVDRVLSSPRGFAQYARASRPVKKLAGTGQQLYMMGITPKILLVFTKTDDEIRVLDLVERRRVDHSLPPRSGRRAQRKKGESGGDV